MYVHATCSRIVQYSGAGRNTVSQRVTWAVSSRRPLFPCHVSVHTVGIEPPMTPRFKIHWRFESTGNIDVSASSWTPGLGLRNNVVIILHPKPQSFHLSLLSKWSLSKSSAPSSHYCISITRSGSKKAHVVHVINYIKMKEKTPRNHVRSS